MSAESERTHLQLEAIRMDIRTVREEVNNVRELLQGKNDPSKGMIVRLDRLEQNESRRSWLSKTTIGACIGAIVTAIIAFFHH